MKITIYELLGLIKDGKAPKTFKYDSSVWTYDYESFAYWNDKGVEFEDYMDDGLMKYLNDEVKIIEEPQEHKIPEKMSFVYKTEDDMQNANNERFKNCINEIIDYLEEIE